MKKRIIKKKISAVYGGRAKTGTTYFWPKTSDGDGLLITEYRLPQKARVQLARAALYSNHPWYDGYQVAALYWLPSNGEPEKIFDRRDKR